MTGSTPSLDEAKRAIQLAVLDTTGLLEPVLDAADGMRWNLEARGWSPTVAEQCASVWLATTLQAIASGGKA